MRAIDVNLVSYEKNDAVDVRYIRIPKEVASFMVGLHHQHGVIGFEYDFTTPGDSLGVIVSR